MAQNEDSGAIYGVKDIFFNGVKLGLISEEGLQPGGDAPTKTRVWAAQKRNAPFVVIKTNPGTKVWSFTLIEMKAENMKAVNGGTVADDNSYEPPTEDLELEGVVDIVAVSGHTLRLNNGLLTATFANGFNFTTTLGLACELEMQEAGTLPAYKIYPPGVTPPEVASATPQVDEQDE